MPPGCAAHKVGPSDDGLGAGTQVVWVAVAMDAEPRKTEDQAPRGVPNHASGRSGDVRRSGGSGSAAWRGKQPRRIVRPAAVIAAVALLLVGGTLVGRAVRDLGCGHGERGVLTQLAPLGGAGVTVSEDALKDTCVAQYATVASPAEVLAHHGDQLAAQGWRVEGPFLAPQWDPPYLSARRGAHSVDINVVCPTCESNRVPAGSEYIVQLSAVYHG